MIFEELLEKNPKALIWDGFDQAYIGYTYSHIEKEPVAVYDYYTMLDLVIDGIFETEDNVTDDEAFSLAIEHLDYNVIGGSLGEFTPVVMYKDG